LIWFYYIDENWGSCPVVAIDFQGQRVKYLKHIDSNESKIGYDFNKIIDIRINREVNPITYDAIGNIVLKEKDTPDAIYGGFYDIIERKPTPSFLISDSGEKVEMIYYGDKCYKPPTKVPGFGFNEGYFGLSVPGVKGYNTPMDLPDSLYKEYVYFTKLDLRRYS